MNHERCCKNDNHFHNKMTAPLIYSESLPICFDRLVKQRNGDGAHGFETANDAVTASGALGTNDNVR